MMPVSLLEARALGAYRGNRTIFRNISFTLKAGEALLMAGSNGSGKSTLLRILAGLFTASQGTLLWNGQPTINNDDYRRALGYVGHADAIKPELTVAEQLAYWHALDPSNPSPPAPQNILAVLGLDHVQKRTAHSLSAGQKRRLALCRLLLHPRQLWLLDEPATALDETARRRLTGMIAAHRAAGGIAIIATHQDIAIKDAAVVSLDAAWSDGAAPASHALDDSIMRL